MSADVDPSVYFLGGGNSDSRDVTPQLVGAKAYNLMRMDRAGLPVPPAFVIGTGVCREYFARGGRLPEGFHDLLGANVRRLENVTGCTFGGHRRPLLVAVRSGAPVSMPGMLESVLNVGLNDRTVHGLIRHSGNPRLAWDSYRRLVEAYAGVVHGAPRAPFERLAARHLDDDLFPALETLDPATLRELVHDSLELAHATCGARFPQDPMAQLAECIGAVFRSWRGEKVATYRRLNGLDEGLGTAVTVQAMVFGNAGGTSGSGVCFTRDPSTGDNALYLDFVFNAQGEDVVSGRRPVTDGGRLAERLPGAYAQLERMRGLLEAEFRDLQDFEFTVQDGEVYLLQTRSGKRTPWAALQVAVDLVEEGVIDVATALERLSALDLDAIERVRLARADACVPLAEATPASIGVASGVVALNAERACARAERGDPVILVREDIATEDIAGLAAASGVLTARGGRTSHAAVVARQLSKVCLVGCAGLAVMADGLGCRIGEARLREGDWLSLDGNTGRVYPGRLEVLRERPDAALARVARWREESAVA